ncbi:hypothetical protein A4A49_19575 [Nicotiana attenuata]|uniref:Uncharacterized protein n=1 Tax=Nicotiana attenuata TaxID=49451 RepID=A0A314KM61_NICAT|nr:hypothetical protein A4A49_19575 [Nicotiana attenuata]
MSLSPHSTPVLVEKSIDERNMRRQNRSDSVKVLESQKDVAGQSEKKKSKRVRVDDDEGKRKRVTEDKVNLGVKPKNFKNISPTTEELRRFTLLVEVNDEYQKYLTSRNRGKLPIDDSDDFVTPPPKQIKELVPLNKAPGVQPVDYDCELQKLKADVKQLGASEDKYGAHPEEDTSGRHDNNDFVSNMEFDGNEDAEMDGCKVGGSEGKDVPHSQGETSEHHHDNIVLDAADKLGVIIMEGPSGVKVNMFVAKVTFIPDVAHAGAIGETADEVAGETEEEFEK